MDTVATTGLQRFVRYAYPPNRIGHCGPADASALHAYGTTGVTDAGLGELVAAFTGPQPYLSVLAAAARVDDPFHPQVVEAYWVGNGLLDLVAPALLASVADDALAQRLGRDGERVREAVWRGGVAHHGFHVFEVYPWVGLLRSTGKDDALDVLDGCRISWGRVLAVTGDDVVVTRRPLTWDGHRLALGAPQARRVRWADDGVGFIAAPIVGDWVSLHWDRVCEVLTQPATRRLSVLTEHQLDAVNADPGRRGPGRAIEGMSGPSRGFAFTIDREGG